MLILLHKKTRSPSQKKMIWEERFYGQHNIWMYQRMRNASAAISPAINASKITKWYLYNPESIFFYRNATYYKEYYNFKEEKYFFETKNTSRHRQKVIPKTQTLWLLEIAPPKQPLAEHYCEALKP